MIKPNLKPQQKLANILAILAKHGIDEGAALVGIRGYYKDSMGKKGVNDRGIYDDAIFLVAPECFLAFNGNCDPGYYKHRVANLKEGVWQYKIGIHGLSKPAPKRYKALVQAAPVTVIRDQVGPDTGYFGINIHRGGANSVSSAGCQTIVPEQWPSFILSVELQMKKIGQKTIPYLLISA